MNLAKALTAVPGNLISPPVDAVKVDAADQRGKHNNQLWGAQHPAAKLTQARADQLREIRSRDKLTIKDLHFRYAPDLSYWLVKSIFRSNSCW